MINTRNNRIRFRDHDHLNDALRSGGLAFDVDAHKSRPLDVEIGFHLSDAVKIVNISGKPARASRGRREISMDDGAFFGLMFQRQGQTVYELRGNQTVISPGELLVWHGGHHLRFDMPEHFHKICILASSDALESILPEAKTYDGFHLRRDQNLSRLLQAYFSTLTDEVLSNNLEPKETAVEMTLDLISAALTRHTESNDPQPRTTLFQRVTSYIEERLGDPELSPTMLAQKHHISKRYLHLVFSDHGTTVGAWIRTRRLAQSRVDLAKCNTDQTVTEIAARWGFSDISHFSRSFRMAYGVSPLQFRSRSRRSFH